MHRVWQASRGGGARCMHACSPVCLRCQQQTTYAAHAQTRHCIHVWSVQGVEHALRWTRPGAIIKSVDTLGHATSVRTLPDGKHLKEPTQWHLQEPDPFGLVHSRCGVEINAEHAMGHGGLSTVRTCAFVAGSRLAGSCMGLRAWMDA